MDPILRGVLTQHWLTAVQCDHERQQDNPVCACSTEFLGWHESVGAAVQAWIDHVERRYLELAARAQQGKE